MLIAAFVIELTEYSSEVDQQKNELKTYGIFIQYKTIFNKIIMLINEQYRWISKSLCWKKKKARHKIVQTLWFYLDEALK